MKLFYSPFACSLATHISCLEAGIAIDLVRVELSTKKKVGGGLLFDDNPMGQVPTLVFDDGRVLSENVAVLSWLADHMGLDTDRYEMTRWLAFVATELHKKVLAPIFAPDSAEAVKECARKGSVRGLHYADARLRERTTLIGDSFSPADAYLFWALVLMIHAEIPLDPYPNVMRFHAASPKAARSA